MSTADLKEKVAERLSHVGHKLLVLSGKGGVGKSTVAVNLAAALARSGKRVGLLDVDLHGPSVPRLLHLDDSELAAGPDGIVPVACGKRLHVVSIGFMLAKASDAVIWRGPRKFGAIRQFLAEVAWGDLDVMVIDAPPGTGDEPLAACELTGGPVPAERERPSPSRGAVIVTTPQNVALDDVRRCVGFCGEVGMPIHGIVENMSGLICPDCGHEIDVFLRGGGEALSEELGVGFLGRIPLDPAVVASGESGVPIVLHRPNGPHAATTEAFDRLAETVLARIDDR